MADGESVMNRATRRHPKFRKEFAAEQAKQPNRLTPIPKEKWPECQGEAIPIEAWRSKRFLVVLYVEPGDHIRMTINFCALGKSGGWQDGLFWEEIQQIKREIGRGEQWAVEIFPADSDLVNVANMRHIWLLDEPPLYGWRKQP